MMRRISSVREQVLSDQAGAGLRYLNYLLAGGGGGGGGFLAVGGLGDTPSRCPHFFTIGLDGFGAC